MPLVKQLFTTEWVKKWQSNQEENLNENIRIYKISSLVKVNMTDENMNQNRLPADAGGVGDHGEALEDDGKGQ